MQPTLGKLELLPLRAVLGALGLKPRELRATGGAQLAAKAGHHFITIGNQHFQSSRVGRLDMAFDHLRRALARLGQTKELKRPDVAPANVELVLLDRKLGRRGVGVVVVVQLFATNDESNRRHVRGSVWGLKVPIAPVVTDSVDHAGGPDRNPKHLDRPNRGAPAAKHQDVEDQKRADAQDARARIHMALHPVIRGAVPVFGHGFHVLRFGPIQLHAGQQQRLEPAGLRAVRVFFGFALGVVLAVNGNPLFGHHAGVQPKPEAEEMGDGRMQIEGTVRLGAVEVQRDAHDGDVRRDQRVGQDGPKAGPRQAFAREGCEGVQKCIHAMKRDPCGPRPVLREACILGGSP